MLRALAYISLVNALLLAVAALFIFVPAPLYIPVSYTHLDVYKRQDFGSKMEVSKGLKANQLVVIDAPASLAAGSTVKTQVTPAL